MEQEKLLKSQALLGWLPILIIALLALWGCAEEAKPAPHPDGWADDSDSEYFHSRKVAVNGIAFCKSCHGGADANDYYGGSSGVSCYQCHKGGPSGHPAFQLWILSPDSSQFHAQVILTRGWEACQECHGVNYQGGIADVSCYTCHSGGKSGHPALMDWINPQSPDYHGRVLWESDWDFDHCAQCHGTDLNAGGTTRGCQSTACHAAPAGIYDCDNCHTTNVTTTFYDVKNNSSTTEVTVGTHVSHVLASRGLAEAMDCGECHVIPDSVFTTGHLDTTQKIVFGNLATAAGSLSPTWARTTATCANTYCHGDATPVWTQVDSTYLSCTSCHGLTDQTNAHFTHISNRGYDCAICHVGYDLIAETIIPASHINGTADVNLNVVYGGSFNAGDATCSDVYCHAGATPDWDIVDSTYSACGSCHTLPPATGAHNQHVTDQNYDCNVCHTGYSAINETVSDTDHINLINDVVLAAQFGGTYDSQSQSCNNVACHGNTTVSWTGAELNCGDCHALPPTSGAHIIHVIDQEYDCNICHIGYSAISETVSETDHINLMNDVALDNLYGGTYNNQQQSCGGVYCHSDQPVSWTGSIVCGDCHAVPATSGAHQTHIDDLALDCSYCHAGYTLTSTSATDHINLLINVTLLSEIGGIYDETTGTCSAVGCHGIGIPQWDDTPSFTCISCHGGLDNGTGAPPYDLSGNTDSSAFAVGAHTVHLTDTTFTNPIPCNECHNVPTDVSDPGHFDTDLTAEINFGELATDSGRVAPVWDGSSGTCLNVYCHGNFAFHASDSDYPNYYIADDSLIIGSNLTLIWNSSDDVVCGNCHDGPPVGHMNLTTCSSCHSAVVESDNSTIKDKAKHINGQRNVFGN